MSDFSEHAGPLRGVFINEQRDVRIVQKAAIRKTLLNDSLSLFSSKPRNVHIIDQREINVSIVADAGFGGKLWNVIHAEFEQIADSQPQRRICNRFVFRLPRYG